MAVEWVAESGGQIEFKRVPLSKPNSSNFMMELKVKTLTGKIVTLEQVYAEQTTEDLKQLILLS